MGLRDWLRRVFGKEDITKKDLPVGRESVEPVKPFLPKALDVRYRFIDPRYPREWIGVIEKAVIANPILSQTHNLLIALANTGHEVIVQGKDKEKAKKELENLASILNTDHLINQLISQIAIGGAISAEIVVKEDLSGIEKIVRVPVSTVYFAYNEEEDEYEAYQWVGNEEPIKLNPKTYKYIPLLTMDGSPYGIPPFLAALSSIETMEEFLGELKGLAKKVGLLGFLDVKFPPLQKAPNETEKEYQERLRQFLENIAPDIEQNMAKGIFLHYDGTEAEFKEITPNASGIKELVELNERWVIEGAKAQPSLLGFSTGYTETWSTVALHVFLSQLENIQMLIKRFLEYTYKLHLALKGFDVDDVDIEFEPVPDFNPDRTAEAELKKAQYVATLLQAGVISVEEAREYLGYDPSKAPAVSEVKQWLNGNGTRKETNTLNGY